MESALSSCHQSRYECPLRSNSHSPNEDAQITIERLEFSPLERKIYDSLYSDAKKDFEHLTEKGLVSRNYTHILAMLMR